MSTQQAIIHIVDDDASFCTAISRLLKTSSYEVIIHNSATELLQRPPPADRGCILLDMKMPDLTGLQVQNRLSDIGSSLPIVFLTGYGDIGSSVRAIKGGAEDFLSKPVKKDELLEAIQRALVRYDEAQERNVRLGALRALVRTLTPREREVFSWVVRGKLNKQIAYDLGTSERTIKAHRHSMMGKLKVRSLAELVSMAERIGFLAEPKDGKSGATKPGS